MDFTLCKLEQTLAALENLIFFKPIQITDRKSAFMPFERHSPKEFMDAIDKLPLQPFGPEDRWGALNERRVFVVPVTIPREMDGQSVYLHVTTGREGGYTAFNPQFLAYVDGTLRQGMDINHRHLHIFDNAVAGQTAQVTLHAFSGPIPGLMTLQTALVVRSEDVWRTFYMFKTAFQAMLLPGSLPGERDALKAALLKAANAIDFNAAADDARRLSIKKAGDLLDEAVYKREWGKSPVHVHCIGHTHIDIAWRWTVSETRQKVQRSFATALSLMERYADYRFFSSQPILYQFLKEDNPDLYENVKKRIQEGRWEAEGGMWLEPDCNIPSGESLVRQIYYGKNFLSDEFGIDSKILWLPDTFGYCAALPQIMKKSGLKYFVSSKLSWNEFNRIPHDIFEWVGLDGSAVLSYMLTSPDDAGLPNTPDFATYNATLQPKNVLGTWERMVDKAVTRDVLMTYGYGDGGGGPTDQMLESAAYMAKGLPGLPHTRLGRADAFFEQLSRHVQDVDGSTPLARFCGELYLEFHRGTYTSVAQIKKQNQLAEAKMAAVELMLALTENTETAWREDIWKKMLLGQFHDVLPGSAIEQVYQEADKDYASIFSACDEKLMASLKQLGAGRDQSMSLCVVNTLWRNIGRILICDGLAGQTVISDGKRLPSQMLPDGRTILYVEQLPIKGVQTFQTASLSNDTPSDDAAAPMATAQRLENAFFAIQISSDGHLTSIFDKRVNREVLREGRHGNALLLFEDRPASCDAWNIDVNYREKAYPVMGDVSVHVSETGPVCAAVTVRRRFRRSQMTQHIRIFKHIARIDFETLIDWQESQMLLKAEFPVDIHADEATCGVQFGSVKRSTHMNNSWDEARFEFCAHGYVDLSEYDYGVSLFTGEKYGADVINGHLRLSLLKSPIDPWEGADKGLHHFTYSLFPHQGDAVKAEVYAHAQAFKTPVAFMATGTADVNVSMVACDVPHVSIEAVKPAEDGRGIIVRLCTHANMRAHAKLTFYKKLQSAVECDLMENDKKALQTNENGVECLFHPFEIKTLRIQTV